MLIESLSQERYNELWNSADVSAGLYDYWINKIKLYSR